MKEKNKDLDFLHEVSRKISDRTKEGSPIMPEEVFDIFGDTLERMTNVRTVEVPIFMPIMIEKEDELYSATCHVYRVCKGLGFTEEEAIEKLKENIDLYNKSTIKSDKRMRMEEMIKNIFPQDRI